MCASAAKVHFVSIWPWPLTLKIFLAMPTHTVNIRPSFIEIPPLSMEISCHTKYARCKMDARTVLQTTQKHKPHIACCWQRRLMKDMLTKYCYTQHSHIYETVCTWCVRGLADQDNSQFNAVSFLSHKHNTFNTWCKGRVNPPSPIGQY